MNRTISTGCLTGLSRSMLPMTPSRWDQQNTSGRRSPAETRWVINPPSRHHTGERKRKNSRVDSLVVSEMMYVRACAGDVKGQSVRKRNPRYLFRECPIAPPVLCLTCTRCAIPYVTMETSGQNTYLGQVKSGVFIVCTPNLK